jgi:putative FmdB family regulatory protein
MPIYEYVCEKCGSHLEVMQKVGEVPLKRCRECRGKLEKIISRTSFQLKGSGWYLTDYSRSSSTASADKGDKASEKKSKNASSSDTACGAGACGKGE